MSIHDLRQNLTVPGAHELTMAYKDGGVTEVYIIGDVRAEVPGGAGQDQIQAALEAAIAAKQP